MLTIKKILMENGKEQNTGIFFTIYFICANWSKNKEHEQLQSLHFYWCWAGAGPWAIDKRLLLRVKVKDSDHAWSSARHSPRWQQLRDFHCQLLCLGYGYICKMNKWTKFDWLFFILTIYTFSWHGTNCFRFYFLQCSETFLQIPSLLLSAKVGLSSNISTKGKILSHGNRNTIVIGSNQIIIGHFVNFVT